jgi:hypothetical protein
MALETGTYIHELTITNPTASDSKSQGDDHLRLLKAVLRTQFPGEGEFKNWAAGNDTDPVFDYSYKSRGTLAAPSVITTGDFLKKELIYGHDGTGFINAASLIWQSAGTIATNRVSALMEIWLHPDSTSAIAKVLSLSAAAVLTLGVQQTLAGSIVLSNTAAGAYATTLQSSSSATAASTLTLPPAPPAVSGYVLSATTAGVMSWIASSGGSSAAFVPTGSSVPTDGLYLPAANTPAIAAASTLVAQFEAPNSTTKFIKTGLDLYLGAPSSSYGSVGYNAKPRTTANSWAYGSADTASWIQFAGAGATGGGISFYGAASGTAGNTISPTTLMTLSQAGAVAIPVSLALGGASIGSDVLAATGAISISGAAKLGSAWSASIGTTACTGGVAATVESVAAGAMYLINVDHATASESAFAIVTRRWGSGGPVIVVQGGQGCTLSISGADLKATFTTTGNFTAKKFSLT